MQTNYERRGHNGEVKREGLCGRNLREEIEGGDVVIIL